MLFIGSEKELANYTWEAIVAALKQTESEGRNKNGIHVMEGYTEILCRTEVEAIVIAKFLEDLGFYDVTTGYYDPEIDEANNEVDQYTGWYFVDFN